MKINGECHCGEIAYEAELDLKKVGICHCSDCQALSASAFRTIAIVQGNTFRLTKGTPKKYVKIGASGNRLFRRSARIVGRDCMPQMSAITLNFTIFGRVP